MLFSKYILEDSPRDKDNAQSDPTEVPEDGSIPHFTEQVKKLRENSAEIIEDKKPGESSTLKRDPGESSTLKRHPNSDSKNKFDRAITGGNGLLNSPTRKSTLIVLILIGIAIIGVVLYIVAQFGNESYKIDKFNSQWNTSLSDLRSGNVSMTDYCNTRVHDQKLCDQFWNLKYMN